MCPSRDGIQSLFSLSSDLKLWEDPVLIVSLSDGSLSVEPIRGQCQVRWSLSTNQRPRMMAHHPVTDNAIIIKQSWHHQTILTPSHWLEVDRGGYIGLKIMNKQFQLKMSKRKLDFRSIKNWYWDILSFVFLFSRQNAKFSTHHYFILLQNIPPGAAGGSDKLTLYRFRITGICITTDNSHKTIIIIITQHLLESPRSPRSPALARQRRRRGKKAWGKKSFKRL